MRLAIPCLRIRTINRYLFREALGNFLVCLLILIFAILMSRVFKLTDLIINKGFGVLDILIFIGFLLPSFLTFVIPMSLLLGVLLTLGRLSTDGEIIALKASGMGLGQMLKPIMSLSLIAYAITTFLTMYVSPKANYSLQRFLFDIAKYRAEAGLKERIFNDDFEGLMVYVNEIPSQSNRLKGVLISDTRQTEEPTTIIAEEGYLIPNPNQMDVTLHLTNGSIHQLSQKTRKYQKIDFKTYNLSLSSPNAAVSQGEREKKRGEMSFPELLKSTVTYRGNKRLYPFLVELHSRLAIPFACLIFGLVAVPLGVQTPRSGKSYGFLIGLILIIVYYVLFSFGKNLGSIGTIHPLVSMWIPNLFFLFFGLYLFKKGENESSIFILEKCAWYFQRIKDKLRLLEEGETSDELEEVTVLDTINTGSKEGLMLRLGLGSKQAGAIIAYRERHGKINDVEELRKVRGIGHKTFEQIKERLSD